MITQSNRCVIICGAKEIYVPPILSTDFVIAVDYGYAHAINNNILPNLIVGDFDSYTGDLPTNTEIITAPKEKDDTDTLLAVKTALRRGYTDFCLLAALGARLDHQIANFSVAAFIAQSGAKCEMISSDTVVNTIKNTSIDIKNIDGYSLSVFSHSDKAFGVSIKNAKYSLENSTLSNLFPIGVSNCFLTDTATISVENGILHIVQSKL
ncbi:MAG: thiamine diphosphokinase [Oscillospiraceae bacterium]